MRIWTAGEVMAGLEESYASARKDVEQHLASSLSTKSYGEGVSKWSLIYMLLSFKDSNYPEVRRFHKRKKDVEFRLRVDFERFKQADPEEHRKLLSAAFLRSIDLAGSLKLPDFDRQRFKADVEQALKEKGWL